MKRFLMTAALGVSLVCAPAHAAIEIDEHDFGPTYGSSVADVTIGKPLQLLGATAGTVLHIVNLPFAMASDSVNESYDTLVRKPWSALKRCTGCTPAYDDYIKSQEQQGQVRFTVDGPSEIIIQSNGEVVVNQ